MPKRLSSNEVMKFLEKNNFIKVSQKGSHIKMAYEGNVVIVPQGRKVIPIGTLSSIARQSDISIKKFLE